MESICELNKVNISHNEVSILRNVDLNISKGELVYVIGKTGTGKSTLLRALYGDVPITSGSGTICGYKLEQLNRRKIPFLRRKLGIVFQDFQLLTDRTVYDNLSFVLKATGWSKKRVISSRINEVLSRVDLKNSGYKMPHQLSGGEQQRVVIARAILNTPEVILADEPTGSLDPETSAGIMNVLMDLKNEGCTIIVATHDYDTLNRFYSRTVVCGNNTISERKEDVLDFMKLEQQLDDLFGISENSATPDTII